MSFDSPFGYNVFEYDSFSNLEVAFLPTEYQVCLYIMFKYLQKILETIVKYGTKHQKIIHKNFKEFIYHVRKITNTDRWNVVGALQSPKGMCRKTKVP